MSTTLTLIPREYNGHVIQQRHHDRYIDATAMCRAFGKRWHDYYRLASTAEFLAELSEKLAIPIETAIPAFALIEVRAGRPDLGGGTWIHPYVATNLAQWCSPAFAVQVAIWLDELLTTGKVELAPPQDPVLAMLDSIRVVRESQIETERRVEAARQLAAQAREEAQGATHVANAAMAAHTNRHGYFTVLGWMRLHNRTTTSQEAARHGRRLASICRESGAPIHDVHDARYGTVHAYPEAVLESYFGFPEE
jgi:hypothetical protein